MMIDQNKWGEDELERSRQDTWGKFLTFSTVMIVGVALILILMALFLI